MSKILYVDTETGGLDFFKNPLLEVGIIVSIDNKIKDEISYIIKPVESRSIIEDKALEINGITQKEIKNGLEPKKAHKKITSALSTYVNKFDFKDKYEFITWNGQIDFNFLNQFFKDNGDETFRNWIHLPFIDLLPVVRWHLLKNGDIKKVSNLKLVTIAKAFSVDMKKFKSHRALDDALILMELEKQFQLYLKGKIQIKTIKR